MDLNGYEKETMNGGRGLEGEAEYNKCSVEGESRIHFVCKQQLP